MVNTGHQLISSTRPYPNKTRIKTALKVLVEELYSLQDHIPTKQGLRLDNSSFNKIFKILQDHIPTKQGLRHVI